MHVRISRQLGVCAASIWVLSAFGGAAAQPTPAASGPVVGADADASEIIVTARKRSEALSDVPGSVSVLDQELRSNLVLDNVADYLRQTPGAQLVNAGPDYLNDISIRGQGGGRNGFSETATGIYRSGQYIAGGGYGGRSLTRLDLFDMRNLEIYKGPQGGLYGRNAVGGAVNAITQAPIDEFEGRALVRYTGVERTDVEGVINLPFGVGFALRAGGFTSDQNDGFITNQIDGSKVDQQRFTGGRLALGYRDAATTITLTGEIYDSNTPGFANLGYRARNFNNTATLDLDRFSRALSSDGRVNINEKLAFADLAHRLDAVELHLRANIRSRNAVRANEDLDHFLGFQGATLGGSPVELFANEREDFDRWGADLYLTSAGSSRTSWLIGAEIQHYDDDIDTRQTGNLATAAATNALRAALTSDVSSETLRSLSAYGSLGIDLSDRINLGLEARLQNDDKDFSFVRSRSQANSLATALSVDQSDSWTRTTGTATVRYKLDGQGSVYVRAASAYRPGGFNRGIPTDIPSAGNLVPYDPEYAISAEAGIKSNIIGSRVSMELAAYHTWTSNAQIVTQPSTTSTTFILQNAGDTRVWGLEGQLTARLAVGAGELVTRIAASTNDGRFSDDASIILSNVRTSLAGKRVNRTRNLQAQLNAYYVLPITDVAKLTFGGSYVTERGGWENANNTSPAESFGLIDLKAGVRSPKWSVSVFVKNLTDEVYRLQLLSANEYFNERRTFGIEAGLRF